jgi:YggT family protein
MVPLLSFIAELIWLYEIVVIAAVICSWLIAFNVINRNNQFVQSLYRALVAVTEPLFERIRAFMPDLGAIDLSPLVLLIFCEFLRAVVIGGWLIPYFARV